MPNKFSYVFTVFSILIFIGSVVFFILALVSKNSKSNLSVNNVYTNSLSSQTVATVNNSATLQLLNMPSTGSLIFENATVELFNADLIITEKFVSTSCDFTNTAVTADIIVNNFSYSPTNYKQLYGTIFYSFYNTASVYYGAQNFYVNSTNYGGDPALCNIVFTDNQFDSENSELTYCDKYMLIFNIINNKCYYPEYYGSSPILNSLDSSAITAQNGYVCTGLQSGCNNTPTNVYNRNSLYWNYVLIFNNKEIVDYNPAFMGLYYSYPYFYPTNVKYDTTTKLYNTPIYYSGFVYNSSNLAVDFKSSTGSSYLWGQDIENVSTVFYNRDRAYRYDIELKYLYGTENGCVYTCGSNCATPYNQFGVCSCRLPYTVNTSTSLTGNANISNNSDPKSTVYSIYKYKDQQSDKSYSYEDVNQVKITITHQRYPANYLSDKGKNFGSCKYNGHESLSSYKTTLNGVTNAPCGSTSFSSINSYDFGDTNIALDYSFLRLTNIPVVMCTLQSNIQFSFHGGFTMSCDVVEITQSRALIKIRNYPAANLQSSSANNGFQIYYQIFYS